MLNTLTHKAGRALQRKKGSALAAALLMLAPISSHAMATDPLIEGAKQCTRYLPRYEREYGVPVHLLSAIASTESGRYHKGLKISVPWPWTINAEGKGYYFDTKQEAINAAKRLRAQGVKSMDVGCMQVNLMHHADAFKSIEEAFDPEVNIHYAARFLRSLYDEQKNWKQAAAAYHSRTPTFGAKYVSNVYDRWYDIINRVQSARKITDMKGTNLAAASGAQGLASAAQLASASAAAAFAESAVAPTTAVKPSLRTITPKNQTQVQAPAPAQAQPAAYSSPSMKVIQVRTVKDEPRRNDTLVIHPQAPAQAAVATPVVLSPQAQPPVLTPPQTAAVEAKTVVLAEAQQTAPAIIKPMAAEVKTYPEDHGDIVSGYRAGPRFIFTQ